MTGACLSCMMRQGSDTRVTPWGLIRIFLISLPPTPFAQVFDCLLWILSSLFYAYPLSCTVMFLLVNVIDSFPLFLGLFFDSSDCFLHFTPPSQVSQRVPPSIWSSREACFTFLAQSSTFLGFQPDSQNSLWIRLGGGTNAQNLFLVRHRYNLISNYSPTYVLL